MNAPADQHAALVAVDQPYLRPARAAATAWQRVSPAILPTAILITARWWHDQGAHHSLGDATLSGVLTALAAGSGALCALSGERLTKGAAISLSLAGTFAASGIVAYSSGLALPVLLWLTAAGAAVTLAGLARASDARAAAREARRAERRRRQERAFEERERAAHTRRLELAHVRETGKTMRTAIRAIADLATTELDAHRAVTVAELRAGRPHADLGAGRPALPAQHGRNELIGLLAPAAATIRVEQITDDTP